MYTPTSNHDTKIKMMKVKETKGGNVGKKRIHSIMGI